MPVSVKQFIYGNSLVNYAGGTAQSNVPYWMNQFAQAAGHSYEVNGGYGFLRQFADRESPANEWGFEGVEGSWDADTQGFSDVSYTHVMINPANFIQDQSPTSNYAGDTRSPVDATVDVVRDTLAAQPDAKIYVYEGWADLGARFGFPASPDQLQAYHAYNAGAYHEWYEDYVTSVNDAVPGAEVQLIPVASVMANLLSTGPLSDLNSEDLYVDSAPHGTETLYFLSSMITYRATYGENPPADFEVPSNIHPLVAQNYSQIVTQIDAAISQPDGDDGTNPDGPDDSDTPGDSVTPEDPVEPVDPTLPANSAPVADFDEAGASGPIMIDVLANDTDAEGDTLSIVSVENPANGTTRIVDGQVEYTPDPGFTGSEIFSYILEDSKGATAKGWVQVAVESQPDPVDPDPVDPDPVDPDPVDPDPVDPDPVDPDPVDPKPPVVDPVAQTAGFQVSYFKLSETAVDLDDVDFTAQATGTGTIEMLQYLNSSEAFSDSVGADYFAAAYETQISVSSAGSHELFLTADDAARLYVDGVRVLDVQPSQAGELSTVRLDLTEGSHDLRVEYLELSGSQSLHLDWKGPSTDEGYAPVEGAYPDSSDGDDAQEASAASSTADTAEQPIAPQGGTLASSDDSLVGDDTNAGVVSLETSLFVEKAGLYTINLTSDEQAAVSLGGVPVVSTDSADEGTEQSNSVYLVSGTHAARVEYVDTQGDQYLGVSWSGPDTGNETLPLGDTPDAPVSLLFGLPDTEESVEAEADLDQEDAQTGLGKLVMGFL